MNIGAGAKINLKKKIIIVVTAILIIIAVAVIFLIMPAIKNIKEIGENIKTRRLDAEEKYLKGQSLKALSENLKKIEPEINKLDKIFIEQSQALELVTSLEKIAEKNNVSQKINLAANQKVNYSDYQKIPLQILTQGNFINQLNYLINMENLNYYINIKILELASSGAGNGDISMLIFADTYWK